METSAGVRVADPLVGKVVDGRYRVESRLARGGMATVYEALDLRLDRVVALKVMHAGLAEDAAFVSRFVREAKAAARLSDPHVVAVFDQGQDDGLIYLAMEFVPGRTLRHVLRENGRLSPEQALTILDPVLQALDAAHEAGFVHRDVKPENVLITDDGRVKVADFGLARAISTSGSTATQGLLIGTVAYLSPEQVERGIADARSDVYGAGILLYEMVTGAVPFAGETPLSVAYQHVNAEVPRPSDIRSDVPEQIDRLVATATARDAGQRYPDATEFLIAVRQARRTLPPPRPFGVEDDPGHVQTLVVPLAGTEAVSAAPSTGTAAAPGLNRRDRKRADRAAAKSVPAATPPASSSAVRPQRRRRRRGPLALIALLALGALVAGGAWYLGAGKTVTVPKLSGLTPSAAKAALEPQGLTLDTSATDYSETVKAGLIISTDPSPGTGVRQGTAIVATVSRGPERHDVPTVTGMSVADATTAIEGASLVLGATTQVFDDKTAVGLVVTSDPKAGTPLKRGSTISLVVSKGPAPVTVPKLSGLTKAAANSSLQRAGLNGTTSEDYSKTVPDGVVISQDPSSGVQVARGTSIALVVSKGPPPVKVPDLYKMSEVDARAALKALGLKVRVVYPIGITPFSRVVSQKPTAGTSIPWGSTVTINVV